MTFRRYLLILLFSLCLYATAESEQIELSVTSYEPVLDTPVIFTFSNVSEPFVLNINIQNVDDDNHVAFEWNYTYSSDHLYDKCTYSGGILRFIDSLWSEYRTQLFELCIGEDKFIWDDPIVIRWKPIGKMPLPSITFPNNPVIGKDCYFILFLDHPEPVESFFFSWIEKLSGDAIDKVYYLGGTNNGIQYLPGEYISTPGQYQVRYYANADCYDDSDIGCFPFEVVGEVIECPNITQIAPIYQYDTVARKFRFDSPDINDARMWGVGVDEAHWLVLDHGVIIEGNDWFTDTGTEKLRFACKIGEQWSDWSYISVEILPIPVNLLPEDTITIGESAFESTDLLGIRIPASCNEIQTRAFANCTSLRRVEFDNEDLVIEDDAFDGSYSVIFFCKDWSSNAADYAFRHNIYVMDRY